MTHLAEFFGKTVTIEVRSRSTIAYQFIGQPGWNTVTIGAIPTPQDQYDGKATVAFRNFIFSFPTRADADRLLYEVANFSESQAVSLPGTSGAQPIQAPSPHTPSPLRPVNEPRRVTSTARAAMRRAAFAATVVERVGWVVAVLGTLGGVIVAFSKSVDALGNETSNAVTGLTMAFSSMLVGLGAAMIAAYIKARSEE